MEELSGLRETRRDGVDEHLLISLPLPRTLSEYAGESSMIYVTAHTPPYKLKPIPPSQAPDRLSSSTSPTSSSSTPSPSSLPVNLKLRPLYSPSCLSRSVSPSSCGASACGRLSSRDGPTRRALSPLRPRSTVRRTTPFACARTARRCDTSTSWCARRTEGGRGSQGSSSWVWTQR